MIDFTNNVLDLQFFAGDDIGTSGVDEVDAVPHTDDNSEQAAVGDGDTADTAEQSVDAQDLRAAYEADKRGKYKSFYQEDTQRIVQERLKASKGKADGYDTITPSLAILAEHYGVDPTDIKALNDAIVNDDAYYEKDAIEMGTTTEMARRIKQTEAENARYRQAEEQARKDAAAKEIYDTWMSDAARIKELYPAFDMNAELGNTKFKQLLQSGIDLQTAYEVVHRNEIMPAVVHRAVSDAKAAVSATVAANKARPVEGAAKATAPVTQGAVNIANLTPEQMREYNRRAAAGERIDFVTKY